ncbi:hypothetical protein ACFLTZ_01910 [Chloroflexota bacterium]
MNKKMWVMIGFILFCAGLVVAVVGGLAIPANAIVGAVLAILGLIIGVIYAVAAKETKTLLLATIALLVMAGAFTPITDLWAGKIVTGIIINFATLISPVALIAAIKALVKIGLEK